VINKISSYFRWYIKHETSAGITLLVMTIIALLVSNSGLSESYFKALKTYYAIGFGDLSLKMSLHHWINDALMAIFFFVVGLEIKREFVEGELAKPTQAALPIAGAIGGMLIPALIYVGFNYQDPYTLKGWAIPAATDIAFSIGVLSLLGSRVPISLKVFLVALAIIDDMGAVIIIALFYTTKLNLTYLVLMFLCFLILLLFNKFKVKHFFAYLLVGLFMWYFTYGSGIHATIAGVLLAMTIPHKTDASHHGKYSMLKHIEHTLAPYVSFLIMPIFAFANAGVNFDGMSITQLFTPVPLGICLGLFVGKQLGVFTFSFAAIKFGLAEMPKNARWISFYATGVLTGIGFTMSLFVGNLAFPNSEVIDGVKIGVLLGSLFSTLLGYTLLVICSKKHAAA
jgi:NhaA family Na+:H+ antiporter